MTKVIAFIPARAGSKRLPNKNKKLLLGKPLICWTIEQALECEFIDEIIVSTDDLDIINLINEKYHKPLNPKLKVYKRPKELAQDDTPTESVILYHLIGEINSIVILLQPTSPLRTSEDIKETYELYTTRSPLVSAYHLDKNIIINGAIYIITYEDLFISKNIFDTELLTIYLMPKERSVDIDTQEDFDQCEQYLNKLYK